MSEPWSLGEAVRLVFAMPMMMLWLPALGVTVTVLLATKRRSLIVAGVFGSVIGLFVPGMALASKLASVAVAAHRCPDVGWFGPALGLLIGAACAAAAAWVVTRHRSVAARTPRR